MHSSAGFKFVPPELNIIKYRQGGSSPLPDLKEMMRAACVPARLCGKEIDANWQMPSIALSCSAV